MKPQPIKAKRQKKKATNFLELLRAELSEDEFKALMIQGVKDLVEVEKAHELKTNL